MRMEGRGGGVGEGNGARRQAISEWEGRVLESES